MLQGHRATQQCHRIAIDCGHQNYRRLVRFTASWITQELWIVLITEPQKANIPIPSVLSLESPAKGITDFQASHQLPEPSSLEQEKALETNLRLRLQVGKLSQLIEVTQLGRGPRPHQCPFLLYFQGKVGQSSSSMSSWTLQDLSLGEWAGLTLGDHVTLSGHLWSSPSIVSRSEGSVSSNVRMSG